MDDGQTASADSQPAEPSSDQLRSALQTDTSLIGTESEDSTEQSEVSTTGSQKSSDTGADTAVEQKVEVPTAQDGDKTRSAELSAEEPLKKEAGEPESSYQKRVKERDDLAKDQQRLSKNWQEFSEGKLKWQQEQNHRFEAMQQKLEQALQQRQAAPQNEPTPQEYQKAAKEFETLARKSAAEGDLEQADKYLGLASRARDTAQQTYWQSQQTTQKEQEAELGRVWQANWAAIVEKNPAYADQTSKDYGLIAQLIQNNPEFQFTPDGPAKAHQVLTWYKEAAESSALRDKNKQLEKQLQDLQQRTSIKGSGPTPHVAQQNTDDMGSREASAFLRKQLEEEDERAFSVM